MKISEYEQKIDLLLKYFDTKRPLDQKILKNLQNWFRVAFTYTSNAIEWNTLTLDEVKVLIEDGITIGWKTLRELKETENYAKLVDRIFDLMDEKFTLTHEFILDLHKQLFDWILDNAGSYRKIPITVSWDELAIFPSPDEVFDKMDDFINFVNTEPDSLKKVAKIHYDFVKIHPFEDGNGRIARLLMNLYLVRMNIFPIIFPLSVRLDYIVSLKSSKSFDDFYNFFLRQLYENLKDYKRFLDKF